MKHTCFYTLWQYILGSVNHHSLIKDNSHCDNICTVHLHCVWETSSNLIVCLVGEVHHYDKAYTYVNKLNVL